MPTATTSLSVRRILPCQPEVAFRAWTIPELFQQWFEPRPGMKVVATFDFRVGGKYQLCFKPGPGLPDKFVGGEFLVIDPPRRVEYTWIFDKKSNPDWNGISIVKVAFNPHEKKSTEIVITHERFEDPEECQAHTEGWTQILECMAKAMAEL